MRYRVIDDISPNDGPLISPGTSEHPTYLTTEQIALLSTRPLEQVIVTLLRYRAIVEDPELTAEQIAANATAHQAEIAQISANPPQEAP
jgi:hypothetical protein